MASIMLTLACVGLVLYRIYKYMFSKPDNFPPGPPRIPFLGSYPLMLLLNYKHMHLAVDWLCKYYKTDLLGMYCGSVPTIVANSHASVKALLNHNDFDGKPALLLGKLRHFDFNIRGIRSNPRPIVGDVIIFLLSICRHFFHGRWRVARTTKIHVTVFARLWFRPTFRWIGNGDKWWDYQFHWHAEKWSQIRTRECKLWVF